MISIITKSNYTNVRKGNFTYATKYSKGKGQRKMNKYYHWVGTTTIIVLVPERVLSTTLLVLQFTIFIHV